MKAEWKGKILAESDHTEVVENNHYFPPGSLNMEYFSKTEHRTTCPWKGVASYYSIDVDGNTNENAAWYYPAPKEEAAQIKGHVAFWKGVKITE